jgi:hypothetical protein
VVRCSICLWERSLGRRDRLKIKVGELPENCVPGVAPDGTMHDQRREHAGGVARLELAELTESGAASNYRGEHVRKLRHDLIPIEFGQLGKPPLFGAHEAADDERLGGGEEPPLPLYGVAKLSGC